MDIVEARLLLKALVRDKKIQRHSIMMSYIMREFALLLEEDSEEWEVCGLLHDIDLPQVLLNYDLHGIIASEILRNEGVNEKIISAIINHEKPKEERTEPMEIVLYTLEKIMKNFSEKDLLQNISFSEDRTFLEYLGMEEEEFIEAIKRGVKEFLNDYKGGLENEV
jgi:putative nucleotidyltransferase with HDIG domain